MSNIFFFFTDQIIKINEKIFTIVEFFLSHFCNDNSKVTFLDLRHFCRKGAYIFIMIELTRVKMIIKLVATC